MRSTGSRPRERDARLSAARRRPAGPAPTSSSPSPSRLRARALIAAFAVLLLAAGTVEAHDDGAAGHVHLVNANIPAGTGPHLVTGYAVPGPDVGEITVHWTPATTGRAAIEWVVQQRPGTGNWTDKTLSASTRSYTFANLTPGPRYDIRVYGWAALQGGKTRGQTAIARNVAVLLPPLALDSATVDGATLELVFSVAIDRNSIPAKGSFSVSLAGTGEPPTGVSVDGKTVTLTLATAAAPGQGAVVTYTKPLSKPLRDVSGRELAGFVKTAVNVAGGVASAEAGEDREVLTGASATLSGSGSSTRANPTYSYKWTQAAGVSVTLSGADTATPSFTAPSVRTDLEFSLVVNDGVGDSLADTVTVRVRPPPRPTSAPCVHPAPAGTAFWGGSLLDSVTPAETSIAFRGTGLSAARNSFWFCRPDGTRDTLAQDVSGGHADSVTGLAKGTRYWLAVKWTDIHNVVRWQDWQAVYTTGAATAEAGADQTVETGSTVTLSGSGSSTRPGSTFTYAWTQTGGASALTLAPGSSWTSASPSFTAPSVRDDLVFSLTVNDGVEDSAADTVTVLVRPPPNPASAPCAQPTLPGGELTATELFVVSGTTDSTITFRGTNESNITSLWFCRPDGTRQLLGEGLHDQAPRTVSGLASGTTYWVTATHDFPDGVDQTELWNAWKAVTTTGAASVASARFTSSPASGRTYVEGETIRAAVTWSKPVTVANGGSNANVSLRLDLGADDADRANSRKAMGYVSGSGTDTLTFEYTVKPGDVDADGVWLQTASATDATVVFLANGATLRNGTTDVVRTRGGLPTTGDAGRKVDGSISVASVRFTSSPASGDSYLLGETVRAAVTWSKPVTVANGGSNANVSLRLDVGADDADRGNSRRAMRYVSGSGTATLVFEYAIKPGDTDADGVWLQTASGSDATVVFLANGATLRNGTTDVVRTRSGLPTAGDAGRKVDGSTSATADAGADRTVETGSTVTLSGSGSSTRANPTYGYAWTQTGGVSATLDDAASATPSFTAPSVREDLVFSLVVNDGTDDSVADTVTVRVRPPPNPTSAPCAHPGTASSLADPFVEAPSTTAGSVSLSARLVGASPTVTSFSYWFCRPDGTRETLAQNVGHDHVETVSGLASGTRYWFVLKAAVPGASLVNWTRWRAVTTTGGASIRAVRFSSPPDSGGTYLLGETVRAAVTWSKPVTVANGGSNANVTLRLDLGPDDADLANSRRAMRYVSGSGTTTLTFAYGVRPGDADPDGVWLQTASAVDATMVFLANGAALRNGATDVARTRSGLATTGDAGRKVDGSMAHPQAPVADAGADRTVETGASVTLDGGASTDPNGDTLTYAWEQTGGPAVTLSGANTATPSFTAPSVRTDLVFSLAVNDGARDGAADEVTVLVRPPANPSSAPCAHPGTASSLADPFVEAPSTTAGSVSLSARLVGASPTVTSFSYWFCRPDGTRETLAQDVGHGHVETVSGLASGTRYWFVLKAAVPGATLVNWTRWRAVTTTGGASIRAVRFSSSPDSGGTYLLGEAIRAAVTWSMPVTVDAKGANSNVILRLDLGADDTNRHNSQRTMRYVSGSGTDTLTFAYTVKPGDFDPDGVWLQTESATSDNLVAFSNGATIRNGTVDASITRAGLPTTGDAGRKVDAGPSLPRAAVQGTTLVLTYDRALDSGSVPAAVAFTVKRTPPGGSTERARLAGTPALDRATVTLTLAEAVVHGDAVTLGYTAPSANPLRDASGNRVADFADRAVTNNTGDPGDTTKPTLVQGKIHQSAVELTFSEPFDDSVAPAASQFALSPGLGALSGVSVSGRVISFTTATAATATQTVSLGIATTTGIRDLNGNALDPVSGFALINTLTADPGAPALAAANPAAVDRARLTLTFDQTLHAAQVPAAGAFTVTAAGAGRGVAGAAVEGSTVVLTLASETASGETVTVSFDATKGTVQNPWGTAAGSFTDQAVINNTVNGAPAFSTTSGRINSPSGTLTSLDAKATDPDGDAVTYSWSLSRDDHYVPGELSHQVGIGRFFFMARHECELANLPPEAGEDKPPNPIETVVTVTASDPHGASADLPLTFHTDWSPCEAPALSALSVDGVDGKTVTLTFTETLAALSAKQLDDLSYAFIIQGGRYLGTPVENQSPDVAVSGATVRLRLGSGIPPGGQASVTYEADTAASLGASLGDAEGNTVRRFVRTASAGTTPGTVLPLLTGARVAGTALTLTFDTALDEGSAPAGSRFTVSARSVDGRVPRRVIRGTGAVRVSGKEVAVRLAAPVEQYERADVSYLKGDDANPLRGTSSGPEVADIHGFLHTVVHDRTAPTVVSAAVAGTKLALYYNEALDRHSTPAAGDFGVMAAGAAQTVSGVSVNAGAVTLTLGADVADGVSVAVSYTAGAEPIRDLEGNDAANLTNQAATNHGPTDAVAPALAATDAAVAQHGVLKLAWNKPLDPAHVPDPDAFELLPSARGIVTSVAVRGATVELGLSRWVDSCTGHLTVSYTVPTGAAAAKALRSVWGTAVAGFGPQTVSVVDRDLPWCPFGRVSVQGDSGTLGLSMRFDRPLSRSSVPSRAAFAVRSDGAGGAPAGSVAVAEVGFPADPAGLTLALERTLTAGERLTVRYSPPASDAGLRDADGNAAAPFSVETVVGGGAPEVTRVAVTSDPGADATYALGDTVRVTVTFSEAVEVDTAGGTPQLTIDMDPADWGEKQAVYAGGSGTTGLAFVHEVAEPNLSEAGIAVPADTLALAGGTIRASVGGADAELGHAGLDHDPAHKVDWRLAPDAPSAPAFDDGDEATLAIDENHADGAEVGAVAATDADGDALTYSLSGDDAGHFEIGADGTVSVKSGMTLDHEARASYAFTAEVTDGEDADGNAEETPGADDAIAVTVEVGNVEEPPGAPTDLAVEAASTGALSATWTAPEDTGAVDIAGYELRWYAGEDDPADETDWTETGDVGTETTATIADLDADTAYRVQARARGDGAGPWSASAAGRTAALVRPAVTGVEIASSPAGGDTYALGETIRVEVTFGEAVDVDTAGGTPHLTIDMDPADWGEKQAAYASGTGTATLVFAHAVEEPNLSEPGIAVLADTLALAGGTIRASVGAADAELGHEGLDHDPAHKVDWRLAPAEPSAPAFDDGDEATLAIDENHADGAAVGALAATDADGDALTYSLSGDDAGHFEIGADGAISVKSGTTLDHETKASYAFTAEVTDGEDADGAPEETSAADDAIAVTVEVGNVEEPPGAPTDLAVEAASATALSATWTAPEDTGAVDIAGYELRWYAGEDDPADETDWTETGDVGTATTATIADLDADTAYRVQARASGDGAGPWSASAAGRTAALVRPAVTGVEIASSPAAGDSYGVGETIRVEVTLSEAVEVDTTGGTPHLTIDMNPADWGEKQAAYASGTGTATLAFVYEVVEPNLSEPGIAVLADSLALHGGTIRSNATGADAELAHDGLEHDPAHKVDWRLAPDEPSAPAFDDGDAATLAIDENHADGAEVGAVAATDADGDALTYSLSGDDAGDFQIGAGGAISVKSGTTLDHETKASYAFTAEVTDGEDADGNAEETPGADDAIAVTVEVGNVEEPPGAPTGVAASAVSTSALSVSWTAPTDTGAAAIAGYELRWFAGDADPADAADWTETGDVGTRTSATVADLDADTAYRVQARARGDGAGPWSASADGRTAAPATAPRATRVAMASSPADGDTYAAGEKIRVAVTFDEAVDVDATGGTPHLTIDMDPADWGEKQVAYAGGTGTATLTFEHEVARPNYSTRGVAVVADSLAAHGGTIRSTASAVDADLGHDGLDHDPAHKVDWEYVPGPPPSAPAFDDGDSASFSIDENHADGAAVGTVAAEDADGDTIDYSLSGADAASFAIGADGAIAVKSGTTLDREARASYAFTAEVTDGEDADGNAEQTPTADDTIAVTVTVGNVEEPPGAPTGVTVEAASTTEVSVGWTAPADGGALDIAGYALRWYAGDADPADAADWTETGDVGTATSAAIADLDADTAYRVQVRARGDGAGPWSASGAGRTAVPGDTTPPKPESATIDGRSVTVTFDEALAAVAEGDGLHAYLTVTGAGVDQHPQRASASGTTVTARLGAGTPARAGRSYTVSYFGGGPLADAAGNDVARFDGLAAENLTLPALSVADARADEGEAATLDFRVTLDAAASGAVTVDYATADGTAKAGEDYEAVSGTLTFAAGETSKTVAVAVLDDAVDEGSETLTLTLSNPSGATLAYAEATGTIENSDPLPQAWLARFGRAAADQAMQAVAGRLTEPALAGELRLGGLEQYRPLGAAEAAAAAARYDALGPFGEGAGRFGGGMGAAGGFAAPGAGFGHGAPLGGPAGAGGFSTPPGGFGQGAAPARFGDVGGLGTSGSPFGAAPGHAPGLSPGASGSAAAAMGGAGGYAPGDTGYGGAGSMQLDLGTLLAGTAFRWGSSEEESTRLATWGRGAGTRFHGLDDGVTLSGEVVGGTVGADIERGRWLAGLALAHADGRGEYRDAGSGAAGSIRSTLTSLHPYVRASVSERLDAWGMLGYGRGGLTMGLGEERGTIDTDIASRMGALGVVGEVWSSARYRVAAKSDAMWSSTRSAATDGMAAAAGDAGRVRLAMEGSGQFALGAHQFAPALEVGVRYDAGDAETGYGVELGVGLGYAHADLGLSFDTRGRVLLAHEDDGYREWGASASVRYEPRTDGRGLRLGLESSLGAAWSGVERMWSMQNASELALGMAAPPESRLSATLGYGFRAPVWRGLATPFLELDASGASGRQRAGILLERGQWGPKLELSVERAPASGGTGFGNGAFGGAPAATPEPADPHGAALEAPGPAGARYEHRYQLRFSMPLGARPASAQPAEGAPPDPGVVSGGADAGDTAR